MRWTHRISAILTFCFISAALAQPAPATAPERPVGLSSIKPLAVPAATVEEIARRYPQFQHEPFDKSGINPLVLPFHDSSARGINTPEALAFSFLLSWDLDWAPENYCSRHAYFIFKRSRENCEALRERYDTDVISDLIEQWHATHAVGGSIAKRIGGYVGKLIVYGPGGKTIATEIFSKPQPYHDLLADMDVAAMKAMGSHPRPELVAYLHKPRFKNETSLELLGQAAFAEERSKHEFDLYEKILDQDPTFAEVRYWLANQSRWKKGFNRTPADENAKVLDSRLIASALTDFNLFNKPDPNLVERFDRWTDEAEKIVGPDSPIVLKNRLNRINMATEPHLDIIQRALPIAAQNPNNANFLHHLALAIGKGPGNYNAQLAISIQLTIIQSRYIPSDGWSLPVRMAAEDMIMLGRPIEALQILKMIEDPDIDNVSDMLRALAQIGDFQAIKSWYDQNGHGKKLDDPAIIRYVGLSACVLHDTAMLQDLLREYEQILREDKLYGPYNAYLTELQNPRLFMQQVKAWYTDIPSERFAIINALLADRDLVARQGRYMAQASMASMCYEPIDHLTWFMMDQYIQAHPNASMTPFYTGLEFLYPDDPWVKEKCAQWAQYKLPAPAEMKLEDLPVLQKVAATTNPSFNGPYTESPTAIGQLPAFAVAARVRTLLETGQREKALTLARKYRQLAIEIGHQPVAMQSWLIVSQAEAWTKK